MDSEVILGIEKSQSVSQSVNNIGLRDASATKNDSMAQRSSQYK